MNTSQTFLDAVVTALMAAGVYNRNDLIAPACVLWTDKERQWLPLLPRLRQRMTLLTLGDYDAATRTGPAYYLRCLIAGTLDERLSENAPPIIYLPGYSRQDLRAVEECPKPLQPLAELQYRGVIWTHANGRDWTLPSFLQNREQGMGVTVSGDIPTRDAMLRALPVLADVQVAALRAAAPLRVTYFNSLLAPDVVQHLLHWLDDSEQYPNQLDPVVWTAFCDQCESTYGVDPRSATPLSVVERLTEATGPWATAWQRYQEAPERYPNMPTLLEQRGPRQMTFLREQAAPYFPQVNADAENSLRDELLALHNALPSHARATLIELDDTHGHRREWVWTKLEQARLATALGHLRKLATATENPLGGMSVDAIVAAYIQDGWEVDRAVLDALASVTTAADVAAVNAALLPIYRPWLQGAAVALQQAVRNVPDQYEVAPAPELTSGTCILFSDALRYDVGHRLHEHLLATGLQSELAWRLAALPPVTVTAKPAVSPVAGAIIGGDASLTPIDQASNASLRIDVFRKLLTNHGIQDLPSRGDLGDPSGKAWDEQGSVDVYGHQHGARLAHHVRDEVLRLVDRISSLLEHGWKEVIVVTDHGWLLLPDNLPKAELPAHLVVLRKGRCAVLQLNAKTDQQIVPWYWNPDVRIAIAPDIRCYEAGKEYEHGGISPQECVLPVLRVRR